MTENDIGMPARDREGRDSRMIPCVKCGTMTWNRVSKLCNSCYITRMAGE